VRGPYWHQGLVVSLAIHTVVLGAGSLWGLLKRPEPPEPSPIEARLVSPEPQAASPREAPEEASKVEEASGPQPEPAPAASPDPESARAVAEAPGEAATPQPDESNAAQPEPPEETAAEPEDPAVKEPDQPLLKERVAKVPEEDEKAEEAPPEKTESKAAESQETEAEPSETEPSETREAEDTQEQPESPEKPEPPAEEPEPILSEDLSERIAQVSEEGADDRGSLRQRQAVARFQEMVRTRVQDKWLVPPGLEDQTDLEATVRLSLTAEGELAASPRIVSSNGPGHFNSSVLRAVEKAAPFRMPDGPTQYFQNLELNFSPDMVQ